MLMASSSSDNKGNGEGFPRDFGAIVGKVFESSLIKVDREQFLRSELSRRFHQRVVRKAIKTTPASAGIEPEIIDQLALDCINYETLRVSGISAAAGLPGGVAVIITVPADMVQFLSHVVVVAQKLAYLYGWQQLFSKECGDMIDDAAKTKLVLFMGCMFGISTANTLLVQLAKALAEGVESAMVNAALIDLGLGTVVQNIIEAIANTLVPVVAKGVATAIPIAGALVGGYMTYKQFKHKALQLKHYLEHCPLAHPDYHRQSFEGTGMALVSDLSYPVRSTPIFDLKGLTPTENLALA